ncbi:DUF6782 family putative metallopeptidase [Planctomycetota bacterium]
MKKFQAIKLRQYQVPIIWDARKCEGDLGYCDAEGVAVYLNPDRVSARIVRETVIHELTHAMQFIDGLNQNRPLKVLEQHARFNENFMRELATRNRQLWQWLGERFDT